MGGGGRTTQTTEPKIPEELKPYARQLGSALEGAIGRYPLDFLFQYRPMPILPPSPEEMFLRNVIMGLPFGGQLPFSGQQPPIETPYKDIFIPPYMPLAPMTTPQPVTTPPVATPPQQSIEQSPIADWLLIQQLAEVFGTPRFHSSSWERGRNPLFNPERFNQMLARHLQEQGLPVNEYTLEMAKRAYDLAFYKGLKEMG